MKHLYIDINQERRMVEDDDRIEALGANDVGPNSSRYYKDTELGRFLNRAMHSLSCPCQDTVEKWIGRK